MRIPVNPFSKLDPSNHVGCSCNSSFAIFKCEIHLETCIIMHLILLTKLMFEFNSHHQFLRSNIRTSYEEFNLREMGEGRGLSPQDVICFWLKSRTRKRMRISSEFLISWNSWDSSCLEATIGQSNQRLIQLIIDTEMEARSGDAVRFVRILWTGCSQDSWVFLRDSLRFC